MASSYIKKCDFVCALLVVAPRDLYRIACITYINELYPFDHATFVDIKTGNNAFG
jgi:hypothetical protein